jgi:ankyrin repeat protein
MQWTCASRGERERVSVCTFNVPSHPIEQDLEHYAGKGDIDAVNKLLEMGGSRYMHTALLYASMHGQGDLVQHLLPDASGIDINGAFKWAAHHGKQAIVELFLQSGKVEDEGLGRAFDAAADQGHDGILDLLFPFIDQIPTNAVNHALMLAAGGNRLSIVKRIRGCLAAGWLG